MISNKVVGNGSISKGANDRLVTYIGSGFQRSCIQNR